MTLSRHLAEKNVLFLHLEPPYYNISHTCLFIYLNFPPFLRDFAMPERHCLHNIGHQEIVSFILWETKVGT